MASAIFFTPLIGGRSGDEPLSYLLQMDDCRILLDCGWDMRFDVEQLEGLKKCASTIDFVLLSFPDVEHIGALPYAIGKLGLQCPIYATIPVYKMGEMFMYDAFQMKCESEQFTTFSIDDVDVTFETITKMKYSQHVKLEGKGAGIEITPYPCGHMIGGTAWKIQKDTDTIVYAVDFNHKTEMHLNPIQIEQIQRPSLLITDCKMALTKSASGGQRKKELADSIISVVSQGGNVLIPTDSAGRVLELLLTLEKLWKEMELYKIATVMFLSKMSDNTCESAKSQLEWMSDEMMKSFDRTHENPFSFKYIKLCQSRLDLEDIDKPVVLLAPDTFLESGFSRELFVEWSEDPKNAVIFVHAPIPGTLGWEAMHYSPNDPPIVVSVGQQVPLEGDELETYKMEQEAQKLAEEELKKKTIKEEEEAAIEEEIIDVFSQFEKPSPFFQNTHDLIYSEWLGNKTKMFPMFPYQEESTQYDDYGEFLKEGEIKDETELLKQELEKKEGSDDMEIDELGQTEEIPTKYITEIFHLKMTCKVKTIPWEGRSDGPSIKRLLAAIAPRKMILVHGSAEASTSLKEHFLRSTDLKGICDEILAPDVGETVDVTSNINVYTVRLGDDLYKSLQTFLVGDYSLAYIDSEISGVGENVEQTEAEEGEINVPILRSLPENKIPGHEPVFVGDVLLTDLREVLLKYNYKAELNGGVLTVAGGMVQVTKETIAGVTKLQFDGVLCEEYYKIRTLLYDQYKIL